MTVAPPQTPSLRWSSVRDCARKATYEATDAPARELTEQEQRWLFRGRSIGRDYVVFLASKRGKVWVASGDNWWVPPHLRAASASEAVILSEVPIRWPLGTGHMDAFLVETGTALEFLSSAHASDAMVRSKMVQLAGYSRFYEPTLNACLVVINPASLEEERFPIAFDTEAFHALFEECEERIRQVLEWRDTGTLPARVCSKPSESRGHFCRYAAHCFEDWQEPEPVAVPNDPEVVALAAEFKAVKDEERAARAVLADIEGARKSVEAELADHLDGAEGLKEGVRVGPFKVKRTFTQRAMTLDVKKAELAGLLNPEMLAEFYRPGASYYTTTVERVDLDAHADLDFGEEPPW